MGKFFHIDKTYNILLFMIFLYISAFMVVSAYMTPSYWIDELYSVYVAESAFSERLRLYRGDVHPPLYFEILSAWIALFGASEAVVRGLSIIGALLILPAYNPLKRIYGRKVSKIFFLLIFSNYNFIYFALEARSYIFLITGSTWLMISALQLKAGRTILFSAILASLHFFGALISGIIGLFFFYKTRYKKSGPFVSICILAISCFWPILYLTYGSTASLIGGNFWISSSGYAVLSDALHAIFPPFYAISSASRYIFRDYFEIISAILFSMTFLGIFLISIRGEVSGSNIKRDILFLTVCVVFSLAFSIIIGFHTPISTYKNQTILVPFVSLLFAIALSKIDHIKFIWYFVFLYISLSIFVSFSRLDKKFMPLEDWKGSALVAHEFLVANPLNELYIYLPVLPRTDREISDVVNRFSYYFPEGTSFNPIDLDNLERLSPGAVIYFGRVEAQSKQDGTCENIITTTLQGFGFTFEVFFPNQAWSCMNGVVHVQSHSPEPSN